MARQEALVKIFYTPVGGQSPPAGVSYDCFGSCVYVYILSVVYFYPRPRGRRVQYLVCVCMCLSVCYHKIAVKFNYLKI